MFSCCGPGWHDRRTENHARCTARPRILLVALFTRGLWLAPAGGETEVAFLDVGQGSATFIRLPAGDNHLA